METAVLNINTIIPSPFNPRLDIRPGDALYEKIKRSINGFGAVEPLIVNSHNSHCIGGNQRLQVMRDIGIEEAVCVILSEPDENREKALTIALNKVKGQWDNDKLADMLESLSGVGDGIDITASGFSEEEIENIIENWDAMKQEADPGAISGTQPQYTLCSVAGYKFKLTTEEYTGLIDQIKLQKGFSPEIIVAELKRRLGAP